MTSNTANSRPEAGLFERFDALPPWARLAIRSAACNWSVRDVCDVLKWQLRDGSTPAEAVQHFADVERMNLAAERSIYYPGAYPDLPPMREDGVRGHYLRRPG